MPRPAVGYRRGVEKPEPQAHEIGTRTYLVADVEPLDVTGVRTVGVGTVLFLLAFVLMLPFYGTLRDVGRGWWLWTCLAGFGLGLFGFDFCRRRARALHRSDLPRSDVDRAVPE